MKNRVLLLAVALVVAGLVLTVQRAAADSACSDPYTVVRGDFLNKIAQKCGTTLANLIKANPQIPNINLIYPGQQIHLTGTGGTGSVGATPIPVTSGGTTYIIRYGDTLWGISQRFGVTLVALQNANPQIKNHRLIFVGQKVNIP